jgi:hypothetical protein
MTRVLIGLLITIGGSQPVLAQRLSSLGVAAGAVGQEAASATAGFTASAGVHWGWSWLLMLQTSVGDLRAQPTPGTQRDVSLAGLLATEFARGIFLLAAGGSLHNVHRDFVNAPDSQRLRVAGTTVLGLRVPVAGPAVSLELLLRSDVFLANPQATALLGIRVKPGMPTRLVRGEPAHEQVIAGRTAAWNDVLMQLILLQQSLESFTRIREIETGIELEFDQTAVTLYDDVAKAARVLAAADPPVMLSVFAPNAGRVGAAATAGSFPAERMRLQRDDRVFLRVER